MQKTPDFVKKFIIFAAIRPALAGLNPTDSWKIMAFFTCHQPKNETFSPSSRQAWKQTEPAGIGCYNYDWYQRT